MEFIKQEGIGHKVQRLYVHWDITTVCEYKCSYCYAIKEYKDKWMRPGPWKKQLEVIEELSKATLPVFLGLLGGEPTRHHKYFEMINLIQSKILNNHKDSRLYITTNGEKDLEFYQKHITCSDKKQYFLFSWHPEYNDIESSKSFKQKMYYLKRKGYKIKVNIMLHPAKKYWNLTKNFLLSLSHDEIEIEIHPHYIYISPHDTIKYSAEFYKEFSSFIKNIKPEFIFETKEEIYSFTDTEIFKNKFNKFKGWNCWNNNFEIGLDCKINQFCFESKQNIKKDYFKNITEILPKICPHNFCSCDGLLKIKKEK